MGEVVEQCAMRMPCGCGCCVGQTLLCIREAGHEGSHKNYAGRWDAAAEFRSADPPYMMPAPERRGPQVSAVTNGERPER